MISSDVIVATADLVMRTGGREFEIRWDCPHTPAVDDDHNCPDVVWNCQVQFKGARLMRTAVNPDAAALALAMAILDGGKCRCGQTVTIDDDKPGCRWQLMGKRWEPGCDAPPITIQGGARGDLAAMRSTWHRAHGTGAPNREQRRAAKRRR